MLLVKVLGPLEVAVDHVPVKLGGPRQKIVLAALAVNANRVTPLASLVEAVWAGRPPSTARSQIQICISSLRQQLKDSGRSDAIQTHRAGYLLRLDDAELDYTLFTTRVAAARELSAADQDREAATVLRSALDLWRGPALLGLGSEHVQSRTELFAERRLAALDELMRLELKLGRHREITSELRDLLFELPLHEPFYELLALALYRSNRQSDALEVFRCARRNLVARLGIEPGEQLKALELAMLNRDRGLDPDKPDVAAPEDVAVLPTPQQLPASTVDFVGASEHLDRITGALSSAAEGPHGYTVSIVAVSGMPGTGKSCIAIRAAHESGALFPDGVLYADLHECPTPSVVSDALHGFLIALGMPAASIPAEPAARIVAYRSLLAGKRVLLVLDGAHDESQVTPLLPSDPRCAALVTSRVRLGGLPGALQIGVDALGAAESLQLLAKHLGPARIDAEPRAARELAALCGGLPLALHILGSKLAARPVRRLSEIVTRLHEEHGALDEFSVRGFDLRLSFARSHQRLPPRAQYLFRLLALLNRTEICGLSAAALLDDTVAAAETVLDHLFDARLVDEVIADGECRHHSYRMHPLLHLFARECFHRLSPAAERHEVRQRLARLQARQG